MSTSLPQFTEHSAHDKLTPLTESVAPNSTTQSWLMQITAGRPLSEVRVLDLGCGRGGAVGWMLEQGWDAYGMDVDPRYIANGVRLVGNDRLALLQGARYPYPDSHFDAVISDQVFEHVSDLASLAGEVARVTQTGGSGLHMFPAKWIFREPHMLTPMVHWLPKGRARRFAIRLALRTGNAANHFGEYSLDDRTAIFADYSETETFYRPIRRVARILGDAGFDVDVREASRQQVLTKLERRKIPIVTQRPAAWLYRTTRTAYVTTVLR